MDTFRKQELEVDPVQQEMQKNLIRKFARNMAKKMNTSQSEDDPQKDDG
jgi:hypothetical protein